MITETKILTRPNTDIKFFTEFRGTAAVPQVVKDQIAAGKLLAQELIENTDDRTGLLEETINKEIITE